MLIEGTWLSRLEMETIDRSKGLLVVLEAPDGLLLDLVVLGELGHY